jgi:hypothetical protein
LVVQNRQGSFVVGVDYIQSGGQNGGATAGHYLEAIYHRAYGIRFLDTNGRVYNGVREFLQVYQEARIGRDVPIAFVPDSSLVTTAEAASRGMVVRVTPIVASMANSAVATEAAANAAVITPR